MLPHAETISAPPEAFTSTFPDILDGVADKKPFAQALPLHLKEALSWPSCTIRSYDLEKKIWETHWKMHVICRKDPDPRTSEPHLFNFWLKLCQRLPIWSVGIRNQRIQTAC